LDSLWRSFDANKSRNYVLVTHGISIRVLLARYFRYTIDQFSLLANPRNCEMVVLGHDGHGRLKLNGRCELELETDQHTGKKMVSGCNFHKRLRVLPKKFVRKNNVRMSYHDETPTATVTVDIPTTTSLPPPTTTIPTTGYSNKDTIGNSSNNNNNVVSRDNDKDNARV